MPELDYSIFVIALDRTSRFEPLKEQLTEEKLTFKKFSAVDGYSVKMTDTLDNYEFTGLQLKQFNYLSSDEQAKSNSYLKLWHVYNIDCSNPSQELITDPTAGNFKYYCSAGWTSSAGALGELCSSRFLWKYIADNNIDFALIFEEDAILFDDFKQNLEETIAHLPDNWGVLYLDILRYNHDNFATAWDNSYVQLVNLRQNTLYSSHGYMINADTARILFEQTAGSYTCCVDREIDRVAKEGYFAVYKTVNSLITTDYSISEIGEMV